MIIKKKLKDVTKEEYKKYQEHCGERLCPECPVNEVVCSSSGGRLCWINHKDLYSDKFLNQEIEVEVPDVLDEVEKKYLSSVIKPFKKRVDYIIKISDPLSYDKEYIFIKLDEDSFSLPYFKTGTMYQSMELERAYTVEELGL